VVGNNSTYRLDISEIHFEELTIKYNMDYITSHFLVIHTKQGLKGYFGPIYKPYMAAYLELCKPLIGRNALSNEVIWESIWKTQIGGRTGLFMEFLSAIDCAVWDLKGKYFNCPVYELLGGPTRETVPCYASMLGFNENNDNTIETAKLFFDKGFKHQKWAIRQENHSSVEEQINTIESLVEALPECKFSFDIFGKWGFIEGKKILESIHHLNVEWIEEPFIPEQLHFSTTTVTPLALGEHLSNIYEFKNIMNNEKVIFIQPDIGRCGGITEGLKVISLAKAFNKIVVPHGHNLQPAFALAMATNQSLLPLLEYHITLEPRRQAFYKKPLTVKSGNITQERISGLGVDYDESIIVKKRLLNSIN
jgi:L-rhamnonate dehydratase